MNTDLIRHRIREQYESFSPTERRVADYLLYYRGNELPSSGAIARELFISEAALTRFAKRCGFHGFRELRFSYPEPAVSEKTPLTDPEMGRVETSYRYLLERTSAFVDEKAVRQVAGYISEADRTLICGIGYSGISALEYRMRLLRIGLNVEVSTESHMLRIMTSLLTEKSLLIALSVSGATKEILQALKLARSKGARTVLITASHDPDSSCDIVLHTGTMRDLASGIVVSPQLPLLFMLDLLYSNLISENYSSAMSAHSATLSALGLKTSADARHHRPESADPPAAQK